MKNDIRTRFAPSPTGYMHIGNLRTALYEYLIAKSGGGKFVLRIEDTDRARLVEGAEQVIYNTLCAVKIIHDEGPDIGGEYGPYVQSERKGEYMKYAKRLVESGDAYYCFCEKSEEALQNTDVISGHSDKCRDMNLQEANKLLALGKKFVIRQKMPQSGSVSFDDVVFGKVTIESKELEDQILIKSDGYPTYNFANVVDDHEMHITHVVRGSEYLSSTPKYNLLYNALGWEPPIYVHLPLIMGKNEDGSVSKLSKRHGAVSFEDLTKSGYLPEAIINYIAFLGWCPNSNREIFSLDELVKEFSADRISKSPAVFDYKKLDWFNAEYLRAKTPSEFKKLAEPYIADALAGKNISHEALAKLLQQRISRLGEIPSMIDFFANLPEYEIDLFTNKKSKTNFEISLDILVKIGCQLENLKKWNYESIHDTLINFAQSEGLKNGTAMWPVRIAVSGKAMTPGGAVEILEILGKEESLSRIDKAVTMLKNEQAKKG